MVNPVSPWRKNVGDQGASVFQWTKSETLALAAPSCNVCIGLGLYIGQGGRTRPCNCVLRAIFRACYGRYRDIQAREKYLSRVSWELRGCASGRMGFTWGRRDEEYAADFELIARRTLDERHLAVFWAHFVNGLHWVACCKVLHMDRGNFFHSVYRLEAKLGRVFRELTPYALFPVADYFHGPSIEVRSSLETRIVKRVFASHTPAIRPSNSASAA